MSTTTFYIGFLLLMGNLPGPVFLAHISDIYILETIDTHFLQELDEDKLWKQTLNSNKIEDYEIYVSKYPDGKYVEKAYKNIVKLRDDEAWARATATHTLQAYQKYKLIYPRGLHTQEANQRIAQMGGKVASSPVSSSRKTTPPDPEEKLWKTTTESDDIGQYKHYLTQYPEGKYLLEALQHIPIEVNSIRDPSDALTYYIEIRYATPDLMISEIRIPSEDLPPYLTGDIPIPDKPLSSYINWEEGNIRISIEQKKPTYITFKIVLGDPARYDIHLTDNGASQLITLEADIPPIALLKVENINTDSDTLLFSIRGGVPDYFLRLVPEGNLIREGEPDQPLLKADHQQNSYFITKSSLLDAGVPNGLYDLYIFDSRKTEYQSWGDEQLQINPDGLEIKIWHVLLPVILIIIVLIFILNYKRSNKNPGYGAM